MSGSLLLVEHVPLDDRDDGRARAALLRLNRPEQLNPIDDEMLSALDRALDEFAADPTVRCVLVTGAGRAFSAGGDLTRYVTLQRDPVAFPRFVTHLHETFGRLRTLPVPVVALVNGVTAAGGLELVLRCDFALVARSARLGDAHLNFGQMGGGGVLTLLPRAIGRERAAELIFTGRFLDADEAVAWGLANRVVDDADLLDAGVELGRGIAAKSPLALANAKEVLASVWADNGPEAAGLRFERERNAYYCLTADDAREGLAAFQEKRRPEFGGT
jgi:enoyl-CoA hydratase/carnithine racemase